MKYLILAILILTSHIVWGQPLHLRNNMKGGVVNGGGGVTAELNGKRRLLDLIEKDDLEYFLPETVLQKSNGYYSTVSSVYVQMYYFSHHAVELQDLNCKEMPTFHSNVWGSNAFLLTVSLSYLPGIFTSDMNCQKESTSKVMTFIYQKLKIEPIVQLRWAFTESDLENLNDEGVIRIENPQSKRQLAIQQGTLVVINKKEFMTLDEESKQALFLHECVLRAVLLLNPQHIEKHGTQYVREYVRSSMKLFKNPNTVPVYIVSDAYNKFEIKN